MEALYINTGIFITLAVITGIWAVIEDNKAQKKYSQYYYNIWGWMYSFWPVCLSAICTAFAIICVIIIICEHLK